MKKNTIQILLFSTLLILISLNSIAALKKTAVNSQAAKPEKLIFMIFDQMRPDYIERFKLKNFKRLQNMGTNYPHAYVGHSNSVTILSHLVVATGLAPKNLPWSDDVMLDQDGIFGTKNQIYMTIKFNKDQIMKALSATLNKDEFLASRFKESTHKTVYSIGEKTYSTYTMGGLGADSIITLENQNGKCSPSGLNVPDYIQKNDRYNVDCKNSFGTENSFYPLDGNRFYPGTDTAHLGGDVWTADVALDVIDKDPNWGALFLTFGAIDKFAHMLGEPDEVPFQNYQTPLHLEEIAKIADAQLGRLLDKLQSKGLLSKTLIISTADHGGQTDRLYLGDGSTSALGFADDKDPQAYWLFRLYKAGKIKLTFQDTSLRVWLEDQTESNKKKILNTLKEISKVTRIFELQKTESGYFYKEVFNQLKNEPKAFVDWAIKHDEELLNTMASSRAPFYVALLADNAGFGKLGDHGGNQEKVQRIPMIIASPGVPKSSSQIEMRLIDVEPFITKKFQLREKDIKKFIIQPK